MTNTFGEHNLGQNFGQFHNFKQILQSWNTWNTWNTWSLGSFAIFAMFFSMALFFHILTYFDISIYAVKENQSGVSFFAKASLSIFAPRSVVSENHKKRPTGWQDIPRSMDRTMSIISTAWTCQHHISINITSTINIFASATGTRHQLRQPKLISFCLKNHFQNLVNIITSFPPGKAYF